MSEASAPKQIHDLSTPRRRRGLVAALVSGALVASAMSGIALAAGSGPFQFEPLAGPQPCTPGGNPLQPFDIPAGYVQVVFASEFESGTADLWDMNTHNETGPDAGRYLYRTHETGNNGMVSVTDLETGETTVLAQRLDWERLDGIVWTPWGTLLAAEEVITAGIRDPQAPASAATSGLVYEFFLDPDDPTQLDAVLPRPAIGSRSHEGLRFDAQGNLYGISETNPPNGFIYRFVPDRRGDLSEGQLYVLDVVGGATVGEANWVPLDRAAVKLNSDTPARLAGGTSYARPEDVEITSSTGNSRDGGNMMYVAITGGQRILAIDLRAPAGGGDHLTAEVFEYLRAGVNAPADFRAPDNLALDAAGNLYITEDPGGGSATGKVIGDDIWVAIPANGPVPVAEETVRFATNTDCNSEPTGVYFDRSGTVLYVNFMHPEDGFGDTADLGVAIAPERFAENLPPSIYAPAGGE